MVAQVGALRVTVGADITGLQTGMVRAQRQVAQSAGAMKRSASDLKLSFQEVATFSSRAFRVAGLAFAGTFGARALLSVADSAKTLTAQLRLATAEYGSFEQANKDVRNIAATTRSDLLSTADLYATLQRNSGQLGATQLEVARATQTVTEAFKVSGASTDEAANATRQLLQAFQSGVLRGDEFNSMMENAPRLAKLLADSLGVTVGQLRAMAAEGKLTSDKLLAAFTDQRFTASIDAEFKQMPVTFDEAMGQVYNAAVVTFGAFDQGGQFSTNIANFVTGGTQGFADLEQAAYQFGASVAGLFDGLETIHQAIGSLHTDGIFGLGELTDSTFGLRDAFTSVLGVVDGLINAVTNLFQAPANIGRMVAGYNPVLGNSNLAGNFGAAYDKAKTDAARRKIMGRSTRDMLSEFGLGPTPPPFHAPAAAAKKARAGPKGPSAETLAKRAQREMEQKLRRDAAFAQEERQNQIALLNAEKDVAGNYADRTDLSLKVLDLERKGEMAQIDLSVKLGDRTEAEAEILRQQQNDLTQLKKSALLREEDQKKLEAAGKLQDTRFEITNDQLQAESSLATTAAEQRDIQLRILDLTQKHEKEALERLRLMALGNGDLDEANRFQEQINALPARHEVERAGVLAQTRNPLEQWAASVPQTAAQITEAFQSIEVNGIEGLSDAILSVMDGTKSLADAFSDMARSIVADILQMTIKMLIFRAISSALGSLGGMPKPNFSTPADVNIGAGGPTMMTGYTMPEFRASGGPVLPGRTYIVGEKGPELLRMGSSGQVIPNHEIGGGSAQVTIVPTPYFNAVVQGEAAKVAAPMSGRAAIAGASAGMTGMQRRASRQLP
jgi:tape measure domain-containing protein